jgi:tetratricopeptide (TPR) repeat protein
MLFVKLCENDVMTNNRKAYSGRVFDYSGDKLKQHWLQLHAGNLEPWPEDDAVQDAWRAYHEGRFADAVVLGQQAGDAGLVAAAFATTIDAQYLADENDKEALLKQAIELAEKALESNPNSSNAYYMYAVTVGRYSQFVNIIEALAQGIATKIKDAIVHCLELQPGHIEGLVTFAGWNAEIVDKAGAMMANLTYGAKKQQALELFEKSMAKEIQSPIPAIEMAYGLLLMYGDLERDQAAALLDSAIALEPIDAMQALDIEKARRFREELPEMTF